VLSITTEIICFQKQAKIAFAIEVYEKNNVELEITAVIKIIQPSLQIRLLQTYRKNIQTFSGLQ